MKNSTGVGKPFLWVIIVVVSLICLALIARFVVFQEQFDKLGEDLANIGQWEQQYKSDNPNATKEEMDAAFKQGIQDMDQWKTDYKQENPNATDAEVDAALRSGLESLQ